jgi:GAF domain-containing protein
VQTQIAVGVLNLDPADYLPQLQANIEKLPDAAGCDAAFVALIARDGSHFETVVSARTGFAQCKPDVLQGEDLDDWPWLCERLGHLKVIEVADTLQGSRISEAEFERLSELHIGSTLMIGFSIGGEIAGLLAIANEHAVDSWDANLHLLLKLVGASMAAGLDSRPFHAR